MDIAVLIVDDFPLIRRGIIAALEADPAIRVVGEADGVRPGLELVHACRPDVVLLDLKLADGSGIELIEHLAAAGKGPPVLVMTAIEKLDTMRDAAAAGARGYLTKRTRPRELRDAIVTVHGGGTVFGPSAAADLASDYPEISPTDTAAGQPLLSAREREVLGLVGQGHTDNEVAERLSLSVRTVQNHLDAIRRKTGLRRRTELASWAIRHSFTWQG
jgi:DNA-binding NarL/FixJ family response regulator